MTVYTQLPSLNTTSLASFNVVTDEMSFVATLLCVLLVAVLAAGVLCSVLERYLYMVYGYNNTGFTDPVKILETHKQRVQSATLAVLVLFGLMLLMYCVNPSFTSPAFIEAVTHFIS